VSLFFYIRHRYYAKGGQKRGIQIGIPFIINEQRAN